MQTVKLSTKGQVVIPRKIRSAVHLEAGMELLIELVGEEIRMRPIPGLPISSVEETAACLQRPQSDRLSDEDTEDAIARMLLEEDEAGKA